jgi:hypothetical protein
MTGPARPPAARLGPGLAWVLAVLAALFVAGLIQAWALRLNVEGLRRIEPAMVEAGRSVIAFTVAICLLKSAAALVAATLLVRVRRPISVRAAIAALWFWWPLAELLSQLAVHLAANGTLLRPYLPGTGWIYPPLVAVSTLYLLLSGRVARLYRTRTRDRILTGLPRLWWSIRGR